MPKSVCFDSELRDAARGLEIGIQDFFLKWLAVFSRSSQVGICSVPWFTWDNWGKDKYFWLVGKQNSETDVCLNVMFVTEAVLTF